MLHTKISQRPRTYTTSKRVFCSDFFADTNLVHNNFTSVNLYQFLLNCDKIMRTNAEFERVLKYFDEDGDGKISPSELRNRVGLMGGELLLNEIEMAIEELDSDGDGLLSLEDFVKLMETTGEEEKLKDLLEAFEMYNDTEICGFITPKSLRRMLGRLGESKSMEECRAMIGHFDLNGDGLLSFEEFRVMMQ